MAAQGMGPDCNRELDRVIEQRRTVRSFTGETPSKEQVEQVIRAGLLAPYSSLAVSEGDVFRRFFVIPGGSDFIARAEAIFRSGVVESSKAIDKAMAESEEFRRKAAKFAGMLRALAGGAPFGFENAPFWIIVAEQIGFPPNEARSLAYVMQSMWLKATALGLAFRPISAVTQMNENEEFCGLLGIPAGQFGLDSCVIGYAKAVPAPTWRPSVEEAVTWF
jgi:nitroreductase